MTSSTLPSAPAARRPEPRVALFAVAAAQFVLMFAAFAVLGAAIGWPQSLDLPAARALPLVLGQGPAVALGYSLYFLSAFLLIPLALLTGRVLGGHGVLLGVGTPLGVLAGAFKLLGILRWLVAMPLLAQTYAGGDGVTRAAASVMYDTLNAYAGGVGEVLGVQLFAGLWTLIVSVLLLRRPRGRVLGLAGVVSAALLLAALAEVYGVRLGGAVLTVQGVVWQLWLLALGAGLLRARSAPTAP